MPREFTTAPSRWRAPHEPAHHVGQLLWLLYAIVQCFAAAWIGNLLSGSEPGPWYASIDKPSWTPPGGVIGAVWTVLYTLMGVSLWLLLRAAREPARHTRPALVAFGVQWFFNAIWSGLFFGLRSPGLALIWIVLLLASILVTIAAARPVSRAAAWLLVPYAAWVAFATVLNATLWWLNRG
ncbi:MAG: TspO/MBR family protein [Planctomycetota bacterium]|nr:TspO/MBR family protein [Planctomycetota bacterium]